MPKTSKKSKYKSVVIKKKRYYFYKITWLDITGDAGHADLHTAEGFMPSEMVTHAYLLNKDKLKVLGIDHEDGNGCIFPDSRAIDSEVYPITRPLYIYVNKFSYNTKPVVKEFVKFYMENAAKLITEIGYVPVKDEEYKSNLDKFR